MVIKERAEGNLVDENVHQSVRVLPHLAIIAKMTIMTKMTIKTKMAMMTKMTKRGWSLCSACTESGSPGCRWSLRSFPPSDEPFQDDNYYDVDDDYGDNYVWWSSLLYSPAVALTQSQPEIFTVERTGKDDKSSNFNKCVNQSFILK